MKNLVIALVLLITPLAAQEKINESLRREAELGLRRALQFLEKNQEADGSWSHYPAITALAVTGFLKSPFGLTETNSPPVAHGIAFILQNQQADGGIYIDNLKAYNTAICLLALTAANNPKYTDVIRRARDFLISLQQDESIGLTRDSINYGGIGYDERGRSDLSNLVWALEALKESEKYRKVSESSGQPMEFSGRKVAGTAVTANKELFWEKAIIFLQRCQNFKTNDQAWAGTDGGFIYSPSESKAGKYTSYGSMSYAGMKSMIYAGVKKDDPRVQAAYGWIRDNYSLEENPRMGNQGLYYYYIVFAKALNAFGEELIVDATGEKHPWREEFVSRMLQIQKGDGYWMNENNRWMESNKVLSTSYIVLALEQVMQ